MQYALIIISFFCAGSIFAQSQEWGLIASPAFSRGRLPNGVDNLYAPVGTYIKVEELNEPAFAVELFREKLFKLQRINLTVRNSLGYLSCGTFQSFDHDFSTSINNVVSIENRFQFFTFNTLLKYTISIKKVSLFAILGPHFGYMNSSVGTSTNLVNGVNRQTSIDYLPYESRFNFGPQYAIGGRFKNFSLETFYRSYHREPVNNSSRRVFNFGAALSYYFKSRIN